MKINHLQKRLANKEIIIMDGAVGTEITRRGVATMLPLWSAGALMTHPELVKEIHADYIRAGAEIIITNTFRTTRRTLAKVGKGDTAQALTHLACRLAQQAIDQVQPHHDVYIAGSMAPLEDCYSPELTPADADLQKEHEEYAHHLKEGGVDFILIETMNTIRETRAALRAGVKTGLPVAVTFCVNEKGILMSGETFDDVIDSIAPFSPLFTGVNCSPVGVMTPVLKKLRKLTDTPLAAYGHGQGGPADGQGWEFKGSMGEEFYLKHAKKWVKMGVQIIGGCCGTDPSYIKLLKDFLKN